MTSERDSRSFTPYVPQNGSPFFCGIQLSNDPTPCRVAGCIVSVRLTYLRAGALTYILLTYTAGSGEYKTAISPKRLKIERKLLLTAYIKSYTGFNCRQNV